MFPGAEIEPAIGDGDDDLTPHDLTFHMGVGIILADIVPVAGHRFVGGDFLQPDLIVVMQTGFVIVDKYRGRDVHGVDQHQALFNTAFVQALVYFGGDIDESPSGGHFKPQLFAVAFHFSSNKLDPNLGKLTKWIKKSATNWHELIRGQKIFVIVRGKKLQDAPGLQFFQQLIGRR